MKLKSLIFTAFLTFPMLANALTPEQEKAITKEMTIMQTNLKNGDMLANAERMPKALLENFAKGTGMSVPQFLEITNNTFSPNLNNVTFVKIDYDLKQGIEGHTPQRDYILFPFTNHFTMMGKPYSIQRKALAFSDQNRWYVLTVGNTVTNAMLKKTYPDLANIQFPK